MTEKFVAALRDLILGDVEDRLVVIGPRNVVDSFDLLGKEISGNQVFNLQRVLPIPRVVGRISQQIAIIARTKRADAHELLAFGQFILIQNNFFFRIKAAFLTAEDRVLLTFFSPRVVEVISPTIWNVNIRLFYVA